MTKELVSIVVPVYNCEKYLEKCLDSLMNQTYKNIEIILIDDGSQDSSASICDIYAEKYSNVCVFHKENGGASSARNMGIAKARGKYIGFIDADDYVYPTYIESLYTLIEEYAADISMCTCYKMNEKETIPQLSKNLDEKNIECFTSEEAIEKLLYRKGIIGYPVVKLFRANEIKEKMFLENVVYGEDFIFIYNTIKSAKKIVLLRENLYIYIQHDNSITHQKVKVQSYQVSWEAYIDNIYARIIKEDQKLVPALSAKTMIYALDFYSRLINVNEAGELCRNLMVYIKQCCSIVLKDKKCKQFNRFLALMCCFSASFTGYLCSLFLRVKNILGIEVRKSL